MKLSQSVPFVLVLWFSLFQFFMLRWMLFQCLVYSAAAHMLLCNAVKRKQSKLSGTNWMCCLGFQFHSCDMWYSGFILARRSFIFAILLHVFLWDNRDFFCSINDGKIPETSRSRHVLLSLLFLKMKWRRDFDFLSAGSQWASRTFIIDGAHRWVIQHSLEIMTPGLVCCVLAMEI